MTTMNTCSLLLVAVAVATAVICTFAAPSPAPTAAPPDAYPCPWTPVAYPDAPFIQKLGSWAVLHQTTEASLHFLKVSSANCQGIGGQCATLFTRDYYYELIIQASFPGKGEFKYRAVVYVTNFTEPQKVMSFVHIVPSYPRPPPAAAPAEFPVTSQ